MRPQVGPKGAVAPGAGCIPAKLAPVYALIPLPFLFASVLFLLRAETAQPRDVPAVRLWKPAATALVIAMCLLAFLGRNAPVYTGLIAVGLLFCFAGDVYLIDGDRPDMFARGLASFLLGHIVFIGALTQIQSLRGMDLNLERELIVGAVLALIVLLMYVYMRPRLGAMRGPVLVYMVVIALMTHRAVVAVDLAHTFPSQAALAAVGAILFMVSDLMLALNRFVFPPSGPAAQSERQDAIWVLTTYYAAIACIALSCSFA